MSTLRAAMRRAWAKHTKGFTSDAGKAFERARDSDDGELSTEDQKFLAREFDGARERMTNLASTVGTAGSFVVVLVALLVSFANGVRTASDKQTAAEHKRALLDGGCTGKDASSDQCIVLRRKQAAADETDAADRVKALRRLNETQAVIGLCVLLGFVLGMFGVLTNPVRGPDAVEGSEGTLAGWEIAVGRLNRKRNLIAWAVVCQGVGMFFIAVLARQVIVGP